MTASRPRDPSSLTQRTLGDLAAHLPGATAVFRTHKLDFCCGEDLTLTDAAARKGLPAEAIVEQLALLDPPPPAAPQERAALIEYIEQRYNDVHRREFPELVLLAARVETVHRSHPEVPAGLSDALRELQYELEEHMQKEEQVFFQMMRLGVSTLAQPLAVMRAEHDVHLDRLRHLEELTNRCTVPAGACATWCALYAGIRKLVDDVTEHIRLENEMLFTTCNG